MQDFQAIVDLVNAEPSKTDDEVLVVLQQKHAANSSILMQKTPVIVERSYLEGGETLLHLFAEKGLLKCLQFALTHGAAIDEEQAVGATAVLIGVVQKHREIVRELLERGASTETPNLNDRAEGYYASNGSPLACAIYDEDRPLEALLHEFRARVYSNNNSQSHLCSPFYRAIQQAKEKTLLMGLQQGVNVEQSDLDMALESIDCNTVLDALKVLIHLMTNVSRNNQIINDFDKFLGHLFWCFQKLILEKEVRLNTPDYNWIHSSILRLVVDNKPEYKPFVLQRLHEFKELARKMEVDATESASSSVATSLTRSTSSAAATAKRTGSPLHTTKSARQDVGEEVSAAETRRIVEGNNSPRSPS